MWQQRSQALPTLSLVVLFVTALAASPPTAGSDTKAAAEALWNQAVQAKGGRDRLRAVRNLVVTTHASFPNSPRPDLTNTVQELYVFPSRFWQVVEVTRPGELGHLAIFDVERRVEWWNDGRSQVSQGIVDDYVYRILKGQFFYLLETAFLQPEPVATRPGRVGRVDVDIVETKLPETAATMDTMTINRVVYYLDRERHLPIRIVVFRTVSIPPEVRDRFRDRFPQGVVSSEWAYKLGEYMEFDGLQMPTVVNSEGAVPEKSTYSYRINVDYDERVFTEPPNLVEHPELAALDGWARR